MLRVQLPGGIRVNGIRHQDAWLRPMSGTIELALAELRDAGLRFPVFTSHFLHVAVDRIGPVACSLDVVRSLSVADRLLLLARISIAFQGPVIWLNKTCSQCRERFDLPLNWNELPMQAGPESYPFIQSELNGFSAQLRVLNGAVEEQLAESVDDTSAHRIILKHVVGKQRVPRTVTVAQIEAILEEHSPSVAEELETACPYCDAVQKLKIDFSAGLMAGTSILEEIHLMAKHYHWSEEQITALPRQRRQKYLEMIGSDGGRRI